MLKTIFFFLGLAFSTQLIGQQERGVILGDDVRGRSDKTLKSSIIKELDLGQIVEIIAIDDTYKNIGKSQDYCSAHRWVNIKLSDGGKGWVYGKFINPFGEKDKVGEVLLNGLYYDLYLTRDMSPTFGEEDCNEYRVPIAVPKKDAGKAFLFLERTTELKNGRDDVYGYGGGMNNFRADDYWIIVSHSGVAQDLAKESGYQSEGNWYINMVSSGQDSYKATTEVCLSIENGKFVARAISFEE